MMIIISYNRFAVICTLPFSLFRFVLSSLCPFWSSLCCSGWASMQTLKVSSFSCYQVSQKKKALGLKRWGMDCEWESDESSDMRAKRKEDSFLQPGRSGCVWTVQRQSVWRGEARWGEVQSPQTKQPDLQRKHSSGLLRVKTPDSTSYERTDGGRKNWKREQEELAVDEPLFSLFVWYFGAIIPLSLWFLSTSHLLTE